MGNRDKRLKRGIRRSYVISTVSIALVLFMLGSVSYVMVSAMSASRSLREHVVLSVELADSLFENEKQAVYDRIRERDEVLAIEYMPREDKISDEEFRKVFSSQIDELLQQNPLRDSYEVTPFGRRRVVGDDRGAGRAYRRSGGRGVRRRTARGGHRVDAEHGAAYKAFRW